MISKTLENTQVTSSASYQMIKDEHLASVVITSQALAGSCVQKSSYRQVVFTDCVFYACEFQGVTFDNCIFENCKFEFSNIRDCNIINCNFNDCTWQGSSTINTVYSDCDLDAQLSQLTEGHGNEISYSFAFPVAA